MAYFFRVLFVILFIGAGYMYVQTYVWNKPQGSAGKAENKQSESTQQSQNPDETYTPASRSESVFVPYWAQMDSLSSEEYDRLIYFGVTTTTTGIDTSDPGYRSMGTFTRAAGTTETWLTVRMLNHDINAEVLENSDTWQPLAQDIARVAAENGFSGVVLDLEVGLVAFHINPETITGFTRQVQQAVQAEGMPLAITLYGDTYYRGRPYNVKELGTIADEVMIMAYDFHKSFGTPGPNFPLGGRNLYNYDFTTMVADVTSQVPREKLSVIFGMYGYEWIVDDQERPLKAAEAVTLNQIRQRFVPECGEKNCKVQRDETSAETKVTFTGEQDRPHVVWFEDEESVKQKKNLLEQQGIGNIIYWAYGYF